MMVNHIFLSYPQYALSLDVSTDNVNAVEFYKRVGMQIREIYLSDPDQVEFAAMETPLDASGNKIVTEYEKKLVQTFSEETQGRREAPLAVPLSSPTADIITTKIQ